MTSMIVPVRRRAGMASARLMLVKAAAAVAPARKSRRVVISYLPLVEQLKKRTTACSAGLAHCAGKPVGNSSAT
ncbi:hypothetical protein [Bradyrhizobium sp. Leo121]|uniref:hypothetical protein n=1 Tax=Bradyrhizobium sp. Leo121 TaxID=1571195 RepID=UPI001FE05750|nr:hypothetical protein [Bradyrhizobium sp. Leo121]